MAYSTIKILALTKDEIINAALRKIGEFDEGDTVETDEEASATLALNTIIAEWIGEGIGLWLRGQFILILNPGKQRYSLGPAGTPGTVDDFHAFLSTELIENTLKVALDATTTPQTIGIEDDDWVDYAGNPVAKSELADGDVIGIVQDGHVIHWTTISDAAGGTDTIDVTDAVPIDAEIGNKVYTYTNRINRPHGLLSCHREDTSGNSAEVELIGRTSYERLSLKNSDGDPVKACFDPQLHVLTSADDFSWLHVWPVRNASSLDKLVMVGEFYPDYFDTEGSDELRFPREWGNALIWALAMELAFDYEVVRELRVDISVVAKAKKERLVEMSDLEDSDVRFTMGNYRGSY